MERNTKIIFLGVAAAILLMNSGIIKEAKGTPGGKVTRYYCSDNYVPETCAWDYSLVCANDGQTYSSYCDACSRGLVWYKAGACRRGQEPTPPPPPF